MKFTIAPITGNPTALMRRAGYTFQHHVDGTGEMSFVAPMAQGGYPRFHAYVRQVALRMEVSIHIDQKKHTYGEGTRHHGEYDDSGALGPEVERLKQCLQ